MQKFLNNVLWFSAIVACSMAMASVAVTFAHADVDVSGAAQTPANQTYIFDGVDQWNSLDGVYKICTYDNGGGDDYAILTLFTDVCGSGLAQYYYHFGFPFTELDLYTTAGSGGWAVNAWAAPGPTSVVLSAGAPTPPFALSDATSSVDQTETNVFYGSLLFVIGVALAVWLTRDKRLTV